MTQQFLLSAKQRDFTMWEVAEMSDEECLWKIVELRWGNRQNVVCPDCAVICEPFARVKRSQLRCRHCDHHFSPLHGSPFEDRKIPLKKWFFAICLFAASAKGLSALYLTRVLNIQYKTALVMMGKLREALVRQADKGILEGTVEVDGGHFCGKPRYGRVRIHTTKEDVEATLMARQSGNKNVKRRPRSKAEAKNWERRKNRRIVMVVRQSGKKYDGGATKTRVAIAHAENAFVAEKLVKQFVKEGSLVMSDENAAYTPLACWYEHKYVQHSKEFSTIDGINENQAESYFSRLRRAEYGTYHGFRPKYLADYAHEFAWREDVRRYPEGEKIKDLFRRVFANNLSIWWRGYWQGHHRQHEFDVISKIAK